jgi:hypothetical protein
MNESNPGAIYGALHSIMSEFGAIGKNHENSFQRYKFRSIADTVARLTPLLIKHKVIMQPCYHNQQLHQQEKGWTVSLSLSLTFYAVEDGSSITFQSAGIGSDAGDKAGNKAMAAAWKYAVLHGFGVPEEGVDSEFSNPEVSRKKPTKSTSSDGAGPVRSILD